MTKIEALDLLSKAAYMAIKDGQLEGINLYDYYEALEAIPEFNEEEE